MTPIDSSAVIVVGLGRFGGSLARTLVEMGIEVLAIDASSKLVQRAANELVHVVEADASDAAALLQLGAQDFDAAIVAIGSDIEASVLVTAALVDLGIRRVWAKAISDQHARILERVGAHRVFRPEHEMGERVAHLVSGRMLEYIALDAGFVLAELTAPVALVGRALGEIGLRAKHRVTVVCIKHASSGFTYAEATTVVEEGDLLVIAGAPADVDAFVAMP